MRSANNVEMTTTSIAGTLGDGAITCTQITSPANLGTFTQALGSTNCEVRYYVEDITTGKTESGDGSMASNVLTRTRPQITYDGSAYAYGNPATPIQFGSTPTSGNVRIRLAPVAEERFPVIHGVNSVLSGDSNWRDYPISHDLPFVGNGNSFTIVANTEYYVAYENRQLGLLTGAQTEIVTGSAGNMKWALYSANYKGMPSAKIVDFTTITTMSSTGFKTDTAFSSIWLPPGQYAIGLIFDSTPAIRCFGGGNQNIGLTPFGRKDAYGYGRMVSVGGSYSTGLPSTASLTGGTYPGNGSKGPWWVGLRIQS